MSAEVAAMVVKWAPNPPTGLSRREWQQYRAGRDATVIELAELTGLKTAVFEV